MSRLVRMDQSGHTTVAEWTAEDAAARRGGGGRLPRRARPGLFRGGLAGRRSRRAGARAPARCSAGDPAPADRRRLTSVSSPAAATATSRKRGASRARPRLVAAPRHRPIADPDRAALDAVDGRAGGPVRARGRRAGLAAPGAGTDRARVARPRLGDPGAVRGSRGRRACDGAATDGHRPSRWRSACSETSSTPAPGSCTRRTRLVLEHGRARDLARGGGAARCSCGRAAGASTAIACGCRARAAAQRPYGAPAARAPHRRAGLHDGGEPGLLWSAVAAAPAAGQRMRARRSTPRLGKPRSAGGAARHIAGLEVCPQGQCLTGRKCRSCSP